MAPSKKKGYSVKRLIRDYWYFLKGNRARFVFFSLIKVLTDLVPFLVAYCIGRIVDFFTQYQAGGNLLEFYIFVAIIGVFSSLQVWFRMFSKMELYKIAAKIRKKVRVLAISKLIDLDMKWHEKEETGSKIQKINEGGEQIFKGVSLFANQVISIATSIFGSIIIFLILDWKYILYTLSFFTIYVYLEYYFNKKVSYWQDRLNKIKEKVSGKMHESASNLLTLKSLGLKNQFKGHTNLYESKYYKMWYKTRLVSQKKMKSVKIFASLALAGFVLLIGMDVVHGFITVGMVFVYYTYFTKLRWSLDHLTNRMPEFIIVKSAIGRFMTIVGIKTSNGDHDKKNIPKSWKKIEFRDVSFKYKNKMVLKDFNLIINRNKKVGIVGVSGCGKSTIVKLLLGLYKLNKGQILIDGIDVKEYKKSSITNMFGVVLQDSEMFNMSLLNNITLTSTKKDLKFFKKIVQISQLNGLIKKLPRGLNTLIGEKGYKLSGGERQRIGIARALFKDSPVLLLDEATSSLDSRTEKRILSSVERYLKDKTLIVIAHRLSTIKDVDKVVYMSKGKIVEQGGFGELVKKKGRFNRMYKLQKGK
ncbi:ABC transporter ATP-binding protein [Nanoarchaeota archaeon]